MIVRILLGGAGTVQLTGFSPAMPVSGSARPAPRLGAGHLLGGVMQERDHDPEHDHLHDEHGGGGDELPDRPECRCMSKARIAVLVLQLLAAGLNAGVSLRELITAVSHHF